MYELLDNLISPWLEQSCIVYLVFLSACILVGFSLLIKGGDWLCDHSTNIAYKLGVPPVVVGLTIVSIVTSAPELFTSISALQSKAPGLILGNIIGSNIANIGLILGIALLIGDISTRDAVSLSQRTCLILVTVGFCLVLTLSNNQEIGLLTGIGFLAFIALYLIVLTRHALINKKMESSLLQGGESKKESFALIFSFIMLMVSTTALWIGADSLVYGSKNIAQLAGVPEELIGFTVLAIGTSLPELAASISLVKKRETAMLLGNIVGSNLFNISLIGGLAGVLGPVSSSTPSPWIDYFFLILTTLVLIFWLKGKSLTKKHGVLLLLIYSLASVSTWLLNS